MFIAKITAAGLKGRTFEHSLGPLTQILGANASGKTAIIEAIRLALKGNIPELGARNDATFELRGGGPELVVAATFDGGGTIERRFFEERNAKRAEIKTTLDSAVFQPITRLPMLDSGAYFSMTATEQLAYIFANCKLPEKFTIDGIIARLALIRFEAHNETLEKVRAETLAECGRLMRLCSNVQEGIRALVEKDKGWLVTEFTHHNRLAKDTIGTVRQLTELKNREGECSAETMQELEEALKKVNARRLELAQALGTQQALIANHLEAVATQKRLLAALSRPQASVEPEIEKATAAIAAHTAELAALPPLKVRSGPSLIDLSHSIDQCSSATESTMQAIAAIEEEIKAVKEGTVCPHCGFGGAGWKKRQAGMQAIMEAELTLLRQQLPALEKAETEARTVFQAASREDIQNDELAGQHRKIQSYLDAQRSILGNLHGQRERDRAYRAEQQKRLEDIKIPAQPEGTEGLVAEMKTLDEQKKELETRRDTAYRLKQDLARTAQAALLNFDYTARCTVIKEFGKELKAAQGELVDAAFVTVLQVANDFLDGIIPPLSYYDGQVGIWQQGDFASHRVLSGSEAVLTHIAISVALAAEAKLRLVIFDEFANLTPKLQARVMRAFEKAIARDTIDQAFIVLPTDEATPAGAPWVTIVT